MIIVKEVKNEKHFPQCTGCGDVEESYTHVEVKDFTDGTEEHLTLCPTCKTTLIRELLKSQDLREFKHVSSLLKENNRLISVDLKCVGEKWINKFGLPLTEERLQEHENDALTLGYMNFLQAIEASEKILEVIETE